MLQRKTGTKTTVLALAEKVSYEPNVMAQKRHSNTGFSKMQVLMMTRECGDRTFTHYRYATGLRSG